MSGCGCSDGSVVVFDFVDGSSSEALAFDFEISVTAAHLPALAIDQPVSPAETPAVALVSPAMPLLVVPLVLVPELPKAPLAEPVVDVDPLEVAPSRQVSVTRSPALKSVSFEPALPSTGSVRLSWLSLAAAVLFGPLPGLRTVTVFAEASVETITALIFAAAPVMAELVVCCVVRCLDSTSVAVVAVLDGDDASRDGVTVLWSGVIAPPEDMLPDVVELVVLLVLLDGLVEDVVVDGLVEVVADDDGLPKVEEDVLDDGLVDVDVDGLVVVEELDVPRAVVLLIVRIDEQSSRFADTVADALPTPLALPDTLADGDVWRQVTRTWSPLFKSLRTAAALASTVSVRLLAAPVVAWAGFRVMVRAL